MNITVYCGAALGTQESFYKSAVELGKWIAERNDTLVYGGGKAGLMGVVADTVLQSGGKVIGIIPEFLQKRELVHTGLSEIFVVQSMMERKKLMIEKGNAYIALPGGPGTLEEISEVISWARIGQNNNPCILFNQDGYYEPLKEMYDQMVQNGFLTQSDREKILFSSNLAEIEQFIENYVPPAVRQY
ncbi:Rossman fold protein, TIGR00730 family [Rodentibacter pneumotropicus]|uniref:Cytokinin riboside 5'-monophosphate phosphoribohydrolase n=1 Tax=Rodentibacter pneumotropicus TaxID=758 RepID=A0AAW5LD39_9PAST|nr:TIGR00730 family Rossman fold protein [Rodentibacter pneumotropicus]MCQ9121549.1 TIGR00730 family Rossman fold protein [Rodentibacter pneumotropicus]OOF68463.1 Rossman fold protein, TIGR00730 family [Rodentibacter pneumotropicus]